MHWYDRIGSRLMAPKSLFEGEGWVAFRDRLVQDLCAGDRLESAGAEFDRLAAAGTVSVTFARDGGGVVMVNHPGTSRDVSRAVVSAQR